MVDAEHHDYRFKAHTKFSRWRGQLIVYPESQVARLWVFVTDAGYPSERTEFIKETARLLTEVVVFGAFIYSDDGTGSVAFRDAQVVRESNAAADIEALLNRAAFPLSLWTAAFSCVHLPKSTAHAAVRLALLLGDCETEAANISNQHGGQLLAVEHGGGSNAASPVKTPLLTLV